MINYIKRLFTPYKSFVKDGFMISVPYIFYLQNKQLNENEIIDLAFEQNKAIIVRG